MDASFEVVIECVAPEEYFLKDAPQFVLDECEENGPIPCEGSGPGFYCEDCRWCNWFIVERLS